MNSALEHARALLARVRDDLYVVRRLGAEADAPGWVLGFHAQQGVEKALKAVLSEIGVEYPRTHNLVMLLELLRAAACPLPPDAEEFGLLVPFGVAFRYEEFVGDEPRVDAARFESVVTRTIDWASRRLGTE